MPCGKRDDHYLKADSPWYQPVAILSENQVFPDLGLWVEEPLAPRLLQYLEETGPSRRSEAEARFAFPPYVRPQGGDAAGASSSA